jgi:hypothetical protein
MSQNYLAEIQNCPAAEPMLIEGNFTTIYPAKEVQHVLIVERLIKI